MMASPRKITIWGYDKPNDTLHWIFDGFRRAAHALNHEQVNWFSDDHYYPDNNPDNEIYICEEYKSKNIPINKTCTYIVHTLKNHDRFRPCSRLIDLRYNCDFQNHEVNYKYHLDRFALEQLGPAVYYDHSDGLEKVYMAWATDLLPEEFDNSHYTTNRSKSSYIPFVGTIYQDKYSNILEIKDILDFCDKNNLDFVHIDPWKNPISNEQNRKLILGSYLAPDVRGKQNVDCGYIPCRIFKNISYGQLGLTNSRTVHHLLEESTIYHPYIPELLELGKQNIHDNWRIAEQMKIVKEKHTYINRLQALLSIL